MILSVIPSEDGCVNFGTVGLQAPHWDPYVAKNCPRLTYFDLKVSFLTFSILFIHVFQVFDYHVWVAEEFKLIFWGLEKVG